MFGEIGPPAGGDGLAAQKHLFGVAQRRFQHQAQPGGVHGGVFGVFFPEFVIGAQGAGFDRWEFIEALGEDAEQDGQGKKRPGDFEQGEPFGVVAGCEGGHAYFSGTTNVTATGNNLGCGSA